MHDTLHRLFRYKAWANAELLDRLAALGEDSPIVPLANADAMPALAELDAGIRASDREYVDYVAALDRGQLDERIDFTFTDGRPGRMSREEMLLHVITHGVGHRGQVSAVMLFDSVPPARDGFTTWLHEAEAPARRRAA